MNLLLPPKSGSRIGRRVFRTPLLCLAFFLFNPSLFAQTTEFILQSKPIDTGYGKDKDTGLRMGRARLHPVFNLLTSYDSNALYSDTNPQKDFVLQFEPGADLSWSSSKVDIGLGYRYGFRDNASVDAQDDHNQQRGSFDGRYRFSQRFSFLVDDRFEKSSDPADVELPERVGRISNEASAQTLYQTPAQDFDLGLRYANLYVNYDDILSLSSYTGNKVGVSSHLNISRFFRLFPKSVLSGLFELGNTNFKDDPTATATNSDSKEIDFQFGLDNLVTQKLVVSVEAGAAFLHFDSGPDANTFNGGVKARFAMTPKLSLGGGFKRQTEISTFTNYYDDNQFEANCNWKFARRFQADVRGTLDFVSYSGPNDISPGESRKDIVIQSGTGVSYDLTSWGKLRVEHLFDFRSSNAVDPIGLASADFSKHRVNVGVDLYY